MKLTIPSLNTVFLLCSLITLSSCGSIKDYKYFADIPDSLVTRDIPTALYKEPLIQSDDILSIAIQMLDPSAGTNINLANNPVNNPALNSSSLNPAGMGTTQNYGYLVDNNGEISLPVLGNIKLAGLSTQAARLKVQERAKQFFKEPSVVLRFANFKVTVLGEVQRPGTYIVPNERITVLDALGYAGDLSIYGKRENILLLRRMNDGTTKAVRLNLNNTAILNSPYFYLQQNDQVYVEPNKAKISNSDGSQIRTISIASALLSFLVVLFSRI